MIHSMLHIATTLVPGLTLVHKGVVADATEFIFSNDYVAHLSSCTRGFSKRPSRLGETKVSQQQAIKQTHAQPTTTPEGRLWRSTEGLGLVPVGLHSGDLRFHLHW